MVLEMSCLFDIGWPRLSDEAWRITAWAADHGMTWRRARAAADQLDSDGVVAVRTQLFRPGSIEMVERERVVAGAGDPPPWLRVRARAWGDLVSEHGLCWREQAILAGLLALVDDRDWRVRSATLSSLGEVLSLGYRSLRAGLGVLEAADLVRFEARRGKDCLLEVVCGPALLFHSDEGDDRERPEQRPQRKERRRMMRDAERGSDSAVGNGPAGDLAGRVLRRYAVTAPASVGLLRELGGLLAKAEGKSIEERLAGMGSMGGAIDPMAVLVDRARRLGAQLDAEAVAKREHREVVAAQVDEGEARRIRESEEYEQGREQWLGEDRWLSQVLDDDLLEQVAAQARRVVPVRAGVRHGVPAQARGALLVQNIRFAARRAVAQADPGVDPEVAVRAGILASLGQVGEGGGVDPPPLPTVSDGPPGLSERLRSL